MTTLQLHTLNKGDRIKLQLIQPDIKCEGRKDVNFYTKGIVNAAGNYYASISFKYKGEKVNGLYRIPQQEFLEEEFKDLKIIKVY